MTFSWPIVHHMVQSVADLKVIRYIFEHLSYSTRWDAFREIDKLVGEIGLPLVQVPYTGMGFLISRYAGVERTVLLAADEPEELEQTVLAINAAHEKVMRLMAEGPSQVLFHSDNLSADVQSPRWLERYSGSCPIGRQMIGSARSADRVEGARRDDGNRRLTNAVGQVIQVLRNSCPIL